MMYFFIKIYHHFNNDQKKNNIMSLDIHHKIYNLLETIIYRIEYNKNNKIPIITIKRMTHDENIKDLLSIIQNENSLFDGIEDLLCKIIEIAKENDTYEILLALKNKKYFFDKKILLKSLQCYKLRISELILSSYDTQKNIQSNIASDMLKKLNFYSYITMNITSINIIKIEELLLSYGADPTYKYYNDQYTEEENKNKTLLLYKVIDKEDVIFLETLLSLYCNHKNNTYNTYATEGINYFLLHNKTNECIRLLLNYYGAHPNGIFNLCDDYVKNEDISLHTIDDTFDESIEYDDMLYDHSFV